MRLCATLLFMAAATSLFSRNTFAGEYKDIEYGRAGDLSLRLDARTPPGEGPFPAVILVHGGGWVRGDRVWNVEPLFRPLEQAGFAWFSISYRLAKDFLQIGTASADVNAAVRYVREHAADYHVNPNRIILVGESAGAHLASLAALAEPKSVAGVVSLYGPMDLEELARTSGVIPAQVRDALNSAFGSMLAAHLRSLSPAAQVRPGAPPFLLIHGGSDGVVPPEQSVLMQRKLQSAGVSCQLVTVPGGGHGVRYWTRRDQAGWTQKMVDWLRSI